MTKMVITFDMDNASFEDHTETTRILVGIARRIQQGLIDGVIRDINGNTIGSYEVQED